MSYPQSQSPYTNPASAPQASGPSLLVRYWATASLLAVTVAVFLLQVISTQLTGIDWPTQIFAKVNELISAGEVWRLITPMLVHGSIIHIGFNMYALIIIGPSIEQYFGHRRYLILYLLSGFAGNLASYYFTIEPSVGASTALFGLIAAQGVLVFRNRELFGPQSRRILGNILFIVVVNLLIGLTPQIDNWGHIGGLIGGLAFAWFAGPIFRREMVSIPQAYPSQGYDPATGMQPQYAVRLIDTVEERQVWITALGELAILAFLVAMRILQSIGGSG